MKNTALLKNPKQKRSRDRVQLILHTTREILELEGVKSLSTNSIAARADIPVSSIYQYFPDKEAVLLAVFEEYLEGIRDVFNDFDTAANRQLPWRQYITLMLEKLLFAESLNNLDAALEPALHLYPELMEADRRHELWMAQRIAKTLKEMGSYWSLDKLKRLAHYLYGSNSTLWTYRWRHNPSKQEAFDWYLVSFLATVGMCFDES